MSSSSQGPTRPAGGMITAGPARAASRAMLKAVGFTDGDLKKPLIGIANTWIEIGPCNYHLRELAVHVKRGVREAGGTPMEFNTVSISDGITMGTAGMRASLISREVIADSIELVTRGNAFDAVVCLVGCDKTIPGAAMALARLDVPGLVLYGGSIAPGHVDGRDVTIQDVFEAVGANAAGRLDAAGLRRIEDGACPGAGACGGQFTANTMAAVCEFLGISPMGSASVPAVDPAKADVAAEAGRLAMALHNGTVKRAPDHHPRRDRKRHRRRRCDGRIDQRCAAPVGDREGSGHRSRSRRCSTRSAGACRSSPTSNPAAGSSRPICTAPAARVGRAAPGAGGRAAR